MKKFIRSKGMKKENKYEKVHHNTVEEMKKEIRNHQVSQGYREENHQARSNFINRVQGLSKKILL